VGGTGFNLLDDVHRRTARMGYWLGETYWGRGIVTEAVGLLVEYIFGNFDVVRIEACVYEWNPASARVLEKAGFALEARHRKHVTKDGHTGDELLFALIRDE
jgi:RimJ/RimL family protein N-acetyltransferase